MDHLDLSTTPGVALAAIIAIVTSSVLYYLKKADAELPLASHDIVDLRIYPIKSCRGVQVQSAALLKTGLDLDRNWMFVSAGKRDFLTIRDEPRMTLIRTRVDFASDTLVITIEGNKGWELSIPAHPTTEWLEANTTLRTGVIWGQKTDGWEYPATMTQAISEFLSVETRLLYKGPSPRVLRGCGAPDRLGRTEATKFADMMPVLVASLASLTELNGRLRSGGEHAVDIERFRPNIIISGHEPWAEDNWKTLRIREAENGGDGDDQREKKAVELDVVSRCLRCQVPNVDPDTADKNPRQPWDELVKYRRIDEGLKFKPSFGMLCVPRAELVVTVGQKLDVMQTTDSHFFINPMK
ncbi:uncharacterized protein B0I36DRAFT_368611 [Microdochium trichocladiopsis]|uniref:MOSC domain-containing protein n=1 Tax=Microdochium trichocladiopsis TaxID=1682393 RepID=A0A9P8XX60_9PEZI|nr:uncharacterized protein B0I36DRAFT_368611 [Microdochium trichocladiopsis]KAH7018604.1 hypothetical protein B0I36DRAFT_368611 [Microdochium trichocladiopsis]